MIPGNKIKILLFCTLFSCTGVEKTPREIFCEKFSQQQIQENRSILVLPPINNSFNVEAPNYLMSSISKPIVERGYYVFPINLVYSLLKREGLADPYILSRSDPLKIGKMFGADAILYPKIKKFTEQYSVEKTQVIVAVDYILKSGRNGKTLWQADHSLSFDSSRDISQEQRGMFENFIDAVATKAKGEKIANDLLRQVNNLVLATSYTALPEGQIILSQRLDAQLDEKRRKELREMQNKNAKSDKKKLQKLKKERKKPVDFIDIERKIKKRSGVIAK